MPRLQQRLQPWWWPVAAGLYNMCLVTVTAVRARPDGTRCMHRVRLRIGAGCRAPSALSQREARLLPAVSDRGKPRRGRRLQPRLVLAAGVYVDCRPDRAVTARAATAHRRWPPRLRPWLLTTRGRRRRGGRYCWTRCDCDFRPARAGTAGRRPYRRPAAAAAGCSTRQSWVSWPRRGVRRRRQRPPPAAVALRSRHGTRSRWAHGGRGDRSTPH